MASDLHSSGSLKTATANKASEGSSTEAENQISISEQRLREADKRLKHVEMLLNVSRRVATIESLDEILVTIVEMIARELKAERGSLLLNDPVTGELYSRVAQGNIHREIRLLNSTRMRATSPRRTWSFSRQSPLRRLSRCKAPNSWSA